MKVKYCIAYNFCFYIKTTVGVKHLLRNCLKKQDYKDKQTAQSNKSNKIKVKIVRNVVNFSPAEHYCVSSVVNTTC